MITYVILRESRKYSWDKFLYLFRAFEYGGEMRIFRWIETDSLPDVSDNIRDFLSQSITDKWQIIVADGSRIYEEEKIDIFENLIRDFPAVYPRFIHLMVMGRKLFSGRTECGITERDIFEKIPSGCRLFYQEVDAGEKDDADEAIFRMACNVLMAARSDWSQYPLEYGFLYTLDWEISQEEAKQYLNSYEQKYLQLKQELDHTVRMFGKDENLIDYLPLLPENTVSLVKQERLIRMNKDGFPFFAWNGETESYSWKDENAAALKSLRNLKNWPVGRWDKEIADSRRFIFTDFGLRAYEERLMTSKIEEELRQRKVNCAEAIFEMGVGTEKRMVKINKILKLEAALEQRIRTRMNRGSFWKSLLQAVEGGFLVLVLFALLISYITAPNEKAAGRAGGMLLQLSGAAVLGILFLLGLELFLYSQRGSVRKKIQREIKRLEQLLWNDDEDYSRLLGKTILYKKYSYLEQQQERLKKQMMKWRNNLKRHQEQLVRYHNYGEVLSHTLKIRIDVQENSKISFRGFDEMPEESGYYDAPSINGMKKMKLESTGIPIEVPYTFISHIEIQRYRFPVRETEPKQ